MIKVKTRNEKESRELAGEFAQSLQGGELVCLYGELGAGKTVFASGVINFFLPHKRVLSPTFIIVRHYYPHKGSTKEIMHIDLYRMENEKEIVASGLPDLLCDRRKVYLVEWADRLGGLLPAKRIDIQITSQGNERIFRITGWKR